MMHLSPETVHLEQAGTGASKPFTLKSLKQPGIWTPRPWKYTQADTGSGNPRNADMQKGERYFNAICHSLKEVIVEVSLAQKGDLPYI